MDDLQNLRNFRDLGGMITASGKKLRYGVYARSNNPSRVTEEEIALIKAKGYRVVIDLRRENERLRRPDLLADRSDFDYCPIVMNERPYLDYCPLVDDESVAEAYFSKLLVSAGSIKDIFTLFARADAGVLFHCESGKDRTGTVAALLLLLVGARDEDIVADYALSYDRLYVKCDDVYLADPDILPKAAVMESFLRLFHHEYDSADDYFERIGFDGVYRKMIREKYFAD